MKKQIFTLITAVCTSLMMAQGPATIPVSEDTEVSALISANSDPSYDVSKGDADNFKSYHNDDPHWRNMGFLKFDLSSLASIDPQNIESIKLKLYGVVPAGESAHTIKIFNMTAFNPDFEWTEDDLTVNTWKGDADLALSDHSGEGGTYNYYFRRNPDNAYGNGKVQYAIATRDDITETAGSWFDWDVTSAILYYAGSDISLQVCSSVKVNSPGTTSGVKVSFDSKENTSGNAPYLEITYKDTDRLRYTTVSADTYISNPDAYTIGRGEGDGVEPFGDDIEIVAMYNHSPDHSRRALLKFNIPYNPSFIESAELYLYGKTTDALNNIDYSNTKFTSRTFHVFNMNYFIHNQGMFTYTEPYDWNEDINFTDWVNGETNNASYVLTADNPLYSRRNPNENQTNTSPGQRYGVPGSEIGAIGTEQVVELGGYHWYHWNLDLTSDASILNFTDEPISLEICGFGDSQNNSLEYVPLYIQSKENESGNAPRLQFKMKESNLLLSQITAGGTDVDDFDPYITEYTVEIPSNAPSAPLIAGTLETAGANVSYTQATTVDGTAIIEVDNGDDVLTYQITFSPTGDPDTATTILNENNSKNNFSAFVNGNGQIVVRNIKANEFVQIFNTMGQLMLKQQSDNNETIINHQFNKGIYFVNAGGQTAKVIVK